MRLAVDQHGAGAAAALAATEFGRVVADAVAQRREQAGAAFDEDRDLAVVVFELQSSLGHDSYLPQASWPSSKRRRCTPTTSRRYQALAMASVAGEVPSAAAAIAAAIPDSSSIRPSSARSADFARIAVGAMAP